MVSDTHSSANPELTSTIHINSLREVPASTDTDGALQALPAELLEILRAIDSQSAMFMVLSGPGAGSRFLIDTDSTLIGRESASDIFLDDITVSRKHAIVNRETDSFVIEDQKSLNGTYVNARPVTRTSLRTGDEVHVGKYRLTFFLGQNKGGK